MFVPLFCHFRSLLVWKFCIINTFYLYIYILHTKSTIVNEIVNRKLHILRVLWRKVFKRKWFYLNSIVLEYCYFKFLFFSADHTSRKFVHYDISLMLKKPYLDFLKKYLYEIFSHMRLIFHKIKQNIYNICLILAYFMSYLKYLKCDPYFLLLLHETLDLCLFVCKDLQGCHY